MKVNKFLDKVNSEAFVKKGKRRGRIFLRFFARTRPSGKSRWAGSPDYFSGNSEETFQAFSISLILLQIILTEFQCLFRGQTFCRLFLHIFIEEGLRGLRPFLRFFLRERDDLVP